MIEKIRRSLVFKTALLFILAATFPYLLGSILVFNSSRKALYNEIAKGMKTKIGLIRDALDTRLSLLRGNAIAWAGLEVMKDILTDDIDKRITTVLEGLKRDYGLSGEIHTINKNGQIVSSTEGVLIGKAVSVPWFSRALSGDIIELDAHKSEIDGGYVISFGVPVRPSIIGAKVIGVLVVEYHLEDLKKMLMSSDVPFATILKRNGDVVAALPGGPFQERDFLGKLLTSHGETIIRRPGYIAAVADSEGLFDFRGFGWKVAVAVEEDEALYPIRRIERVSVGVSLLGIFLILGLVSFFASRAIRPIKKLSKTANHLAKTKNFSKRVIFHSNDEIGMLADAFNHMVDEVGLHISNLQRANIELLEVLGSAIAKRDSDTNMHNYRVTIISIRFAEALGLKNGEIRTLIKGSFLHDVGKIGISDNILVKPHRLSKGEFEIMKEHVQHGMDIIQNYNWLNDAADVVFNHHEKYDGSGYPGGIKGKEIPLNARIFAIVDVFDALTSTRPYRKSLSFEETMSIIDKDSGTHFDPDLLSAFKKIAKPLYMEISTKKEEELEEILKGLINKYFYEN